SVAEVVTAGLQEQRQALSDYQRLAAAGTATAEQQRRLDELHHVLDASDGWQVEQRVETVASRLGLDLRASFDSLSGGWRRRALLGRALVSQPDLLLLDEPTNHLDIGSIEWLEAFLLEFNGALLFISHDRTFIDHLATRIVELDRGMLTETRGTYADYRRLKQQQLEVEAQHHALFDKKLAQEEAWIRQGVEARRTRNEGRVRALQQLRRERRERRDRRGQVSLQAQNTESSGSLVFDVEHLTIQFDSPPVVQDFSARIMRGDRIGLVGPNGVGKSSLIRALLGEITPSSGVVRTGSRLEIAYYDQERSQLKLNETVIQNVAGNNDQVVVQGQARHVTSYLRDFLFRPEQLNTPAAALSGGERNRLMLARLFSRPANLLVMDEPTNDLDIDTLELLEEYISDFPGTLLLTSHDRMFLDHVVTSLLVFEGAGRVREFVGGYSDWLAWHAEQAAAVAPAKSTVVIPETQRTARKQQKLSYKDQRELDQLPERLQELESEKERLEVELADSSLYRGNQEALHQRLSRLEQLGRDIDQSYVRWTELEGLKAGN
ncbi:MAG TPA: ATP-binding cassette domain-containing protein, partial [Steroidobacteraceae bacterium]|nr:ATP-binding cassette domain-containing protein [Steroidobacteraceae bacterium]